MPAAFEPVNRYGIAADFLRLESMANRGTFVDHLDPCILKIRHNLRRVAPSRFYHCDATVDDRLDQGRVIRRVDGWQKRDVHCNRFVGHILATRDLICQIGGRFLCQSSDRSQTASI